MQNDFNFVASFYDQLARVIFGKAIQESQTWLLPFIPERATVLIIGGGTGWLLTEMLQHAKPASIVYLEASGKMLERSQKRYASGHKNPNTVVELRLGTEADLKPEETFNVIFTPFLLDLFLVEKNAEKTHRLCIRNAVNKAAVAKIDYGFLRAAAQTQRTAQLRMRDLYNKLGKRMNLKISFTV